MESKDARIELRIERRILIELNNIVFIFIALLHYLLDMTNFPNYLVYFTTLNKQTQLYDFHCQNVPLPNIAAVFAS